MKLNPSDIRPISDEDPLKLFHASIKSSDTDKHYTNVLRLILCRVLETVLKGTFEERVKQFVEIGKKDEEQMLGMLLGLSKKMAERSRKSKSDKDYMNPSSIPIYFTPVKKLLDVNDITAKWNRVYLTYPELDNVDDSRGWTLEEIQRMLDHTTNARDYALILVLASSGMRRGGLLLRWGDLTRMYNVGGKMVKEGDLVGETPGEPACAAVRVYRNSSEEYVTFITPEAYRALMDCATEWEAEAGRKPHYNDPVFKNSKSLAVLNKPSINHIMTRIASSAGVRKRQRGNPSKWEVPILHGFRRFFDKAVKDAATNESMLSVLIKTEFMMGHYGIVSLDRNYYKADTEEKAKTYVKLVPNLTISKSERLKYANSRNDKVRSELNKTDDRISQLGGISTLEGMFEYLRKGVFADSA